MLNIPNNKYHIKLNLRSTFKDLRFPDDVVLVVKMLTRQGKDSQAMCEYIKSHEKI